MNIVENNKDLRVKPGAVVAHRCALCNLVLCHDDSSVNAAIVVHRPVCERRPVEVGDYVRWEYQGNWLEGELLKHETIRHGTYATIQTDATRTSLHMSDPGPHPQVVGTHGTAMLRRIPRPGAGEQAKRNPKVGDRVRIARCWKREAVGVVGTLTRIDGNTMSELPYQLRLDQPIGTYGEWIWCEAIALVESRGGQHDPAPTTRSLAQQDATRIRVRDEVVSLPYNEHPALVGGITRQLCCVRWCENRLAVEGGESPPNVMTPAQVAAGRAMWLAGPGAMRSAELRAKVVARAAAEANPVRVQQEFEPWE
jgi:hypothetical protein